MILTLDFPKRDALVFDVTENKRSPGHVTDPMCRPDFMAALQPHWKNGVVPWPFARLAGETASGGKFHETQKEQAISYLHYLLLARPDLYVAQGLLSSDKSVVFLFGIGGEVIRELEVEWVDEDLNKLLYAFIYRLYEPGRFADSTYTETEFDEETMARYTVKITRPGGTEECPGSIPYMTEIHSQRAHIFSPTQTSATVSPYSKTNFAE